MEHALLAADEANHSEEEPEIETDGDESRQQQKHWKSLMRWKSFIEGNGSDYLKMIFNELIENVEELKLKNHEQSDIRYFFRP